MPETDKNRGRWSRSLSTKLVALLLATLTGVFALLGYLTIRLHRQHLEQASLMSAERVSDIILRSTTDSMLRDDQDGLHRIMQTIGGQPGVEKVRIFDNQGLISSSTDAQEVNHAVDKSAEACYGCHSQSQALARLNRPDRFRIYRSASGHRVLGIVTPIENQPACSNAACHAHPASQQILGVLDTNLSLAKTDTQLAESSAQMLGYTALCMILIAALSVLAVWKVVGKPVRELKHAAESLAKGKLGYQIAVHSGDELGHLARAFNDMSRQLQVAREEVLGWNRTLESRVDDKSRELKRAHDQLLHVEKMASVGKMAAVVAHEINNPLSGILTYAKLLRRWVDHDQAQGLKRQEALQSLDVIASESRRCGELVKNLLTFSRSSPMNLAPADLNTVVERAVKLVQHQFELNAIELHLDLGPELPVILCDPAQIEQVLLALIMNAVDAMPRGGNLWLRSSLLEDGIGLEVRDDGMGIPAEILPHIFEPFLTTKESEHGVGLGLAISRGIVERHQGEIKVESEAGKGTTFVITLPLELSKVAAGRQLETTSVR
jgi:two-component system NtrC family sensor kinase